MLAYIGLGSNLENPRAQIEQTFVDLTAIPNTRLLASSARYSSNAVGPGKQPNYVNAAALLDTDLSPLALLDALQAIEQAHRRVRIEHWGPRTLDLDILLLDQQVIDSERLKVPHPYLAERDFVLYPLADIAPELCLPDGRNLKELISQCPSNGLVRLAE
jgi:2-amino-4-hydroxy-6-hydroxymethyldihydropteridine diphosphokinase